MTSDVAGTAIFWLLSLLADLLDIFK